MGEAGKLPSSLVPGREAGRENRRTGGQRQSRKDKREKRAEASDSSHPAMFVRSPTETADRKSASSATRSVANNSDAVPSSLADRSRSGMDMVRKRDRLYATVLAFKITAHTYVTYRNVNSFTNTATRLSNNKQGAGNYEYVVLT